MNDPKTILFSPLGDTDPVRDCYDGACLHILRHYRPDMVFLFYTKDMWAKEEKDHRYTLAIRHLLPDIPIREIQSEIVAAHLLEALFPMLPDKIRELHATYPSAKILLNLSSGTPQIKSLLAIMAVESDWCKGIQVSSPAKGSNRKNRAVQDNDDIESILEENLDDAPDAENRCSEPPLRGIAYYGEKNRLLSLIDAYEYSAALELAKDIAEVPETAKRLIEHAKIRRQLLPQKARGILDRVGNTKLLPYSGAQERLLEYFLTMQLDAKKEVFSHLIVKIVPFLYEYLRTYLDSFSIVPLSDLCDVKDNRMWLSRKKLKEKEPELLAFMDNFYPQTGFNDRTDLSAKTMYDICQYIGEHEKAKNMEIHTQLLADLRKIINYDAHRGTLLDVRNKIAHQIANIDRDKFYSWTRITPEDMLGTFFHMLVLLYGSNIGAQKNMYEKINEWIRRSLMGEL